MADLSNQKISDTYGRVLQRDLDSSELQNLLGQNPNHLVFNGTTIRYVDGNQQDGYVLTSDSSGNVRWAPSSGGGGVTVLITGGSFDKNTETLTLTNSTGGTVSISGFTDIFISGVTYNNSNLLTLNRNDGTNFNILVDTVSGWTVSNNLNVSGDTVIGGGLSSDTISANTYFNLPNFITSAYSGNDGISVISGVTDGLIGFKSFSGVNITIFDNGGKLTFSGYPQQDVTGLYLPISGGTVTGDTIFTNNLSASTYQNLPISGVTNGDGISTSISDGNLTITNNSPDRVVTLTNGSGISITGTYPNFTIQYTGSTFSLVGSTPNGLTTYNNNTSLNVQNNLTFDSTTRLLSLNGYIQYNQLRLSTNNLQLGGYADEGSEVLFANYTNTTSSGTIYYLTSSGSWSIADTTTTATSISLLSIAVGGNSTNDGMMLKGLVAILSTNINGTPVIGNPVFLSTSGKMTFTLPSSSGNVVRIMGHYIETINDGGGNDYRIVYFNPSNDYIVLS